MRFIDQLFWMLILFVVAGCVSTTIRLPASFKPKYKTKIVNSLKNAAYNGVLFQVNDSVFRDVPVRQVDRCRKAEAPTWSQSFMELMDLMDRNPQYYGKFHMVDFRGGDQARAEISKDINGLTSLNITYSKRETREKVTSQTTLPCLESTSDYLDKDLVSTVIEWPKSSEILAVLKSAPEKTKVEHFQFNTEFLMFLAERQTVLKINPEVAFERNFKGEYFLGAWLEKMAQELQTSNGTDTDFINYWLKEISTHSKQAEQIQFLGLHPESTLSHGVQVDSSEKFARKPSSFQEPTYMYMSYHQKDGEYVSTSLKDLNKCMQNLMVVYRNPLTGVNLDFEANSFLFPGYSCTPAPLK